MLAMLLQDCTLRLLAHLFRSTDVALVFWIHLERSSSGLHTVRIDAVPFSKLKYVCSNYLRMLELSTAWTLHHFIPELKRSQEISSPPGEEMLAKLWPEFRGVVVANNSFSSAGSNVTETKIVSLVTEDETLLLLGALRDNIYMRAGIVNRSFRSLIEALHQLCGNCCCDDGGNEETDSDPSFNRLVDSIREDSFD